MNYDEFFADAIGRLWHERRYRVFADLHGKEAALVFTSGYVSNQTGMATIAKLIPNLSLS